MGLKEEAGHFKDPLIFFIVLQFYQSFKALGIFFEPASLLIIALLPDERKKTEFSIAVI